MTERKPQALVDTGERTLVLKPRPSSPRLGLCVAENGVEVRSQPDSPIRLVKGEESPQQIRFVVHLHRWVFGRFPAWLSRGRRLWQGPKPTIVLAKDVLHAASVTMLLHRIDSAACLPGYILGCLRAGNDSSTG